jgi:hypothetical protein
MAGGTAYGNTSLQMSISGNVAVTAGTLDLSQCDANNGSKGNGKLYVTGNLDISGTGIITETSPNSRGQVYFVGNAVQSFTSSASNIQTVDFIVNTGATLSMGSQIMASTGDFTLMDGATLMIGSANGITSSGSSGNIQVTGTRIYGSDASYIYNGTVEQNTGSGLPATVKNLRQDNSNNLTLTNTTSVSNTLTLGGGLIIATDDTLTLGTSTTVLGTLSRTSGHVVGYFKQSCIHQLRFQSNIVWNDNK